MKGSGREAAAGEGKGRGEVFGVILAGGGGRRFGGPKALFPLEGRPMAEWALLALEPFTDGRGVVTADPEVAAALGVPGRPDSVPGLGPLGGLLTALQWASEVGRREVFLLACDLPLVPPEVVGRILDLWPPGHPASVPRSSGPLGFEPLCAGYSVQALPQALRLSRSGGASMERLLESLEVAPVALDGWSGEELERAFLNVNTRDQALEAQDVLRTRRARAARTPHG